MDVRFQVALENALLYAHQLMRQVGRLLFAGTTESSDLSVSTHAPSPSLWLDRPLPLPTAPQCCDHWGGWEGEWEALEIEKSEGAWANPENQTMPRAVRTELTQKLRLAELFLRRAIVLLAIDMAGDLPPLRPVRATRSASASSRKERGPRALALVEPAARFSAAHPMPVGLFNTLSPDDTVQAGPLARRLARLQASLANPMARARRLAFWRRRQKGRCVLRPRLTLPRPVSETARNLWTWLKTIDADAPEALRLEPG